MTCPTLLVLLGVALIAYTQRPRPARRPVRRAGRPVPRPPMRAVLRLVFDVALIPFQCVVVAFAPKHIRNRQHRQNR